eukprot:GHVU01072038.1.p1 GENE.GHVU01072038.1~~GHVU01072038.1.p1  ORF type:complete len:142 (+),score=2.02 GHVU01072038.1:952-1377(+)
MKADNTDTDDRIRVTDRAVSAHLPPPRFIIYLSVFAHTRTHSHNTPLKSQSRIPTYTRPSVATELILIQRRDRFDVESVCKDGKRPHTRTCAYTPTHTSTRTPAVAVVPTVGRSPLAEKVPAFAAAPALPRPVRKHSTAYT